MTTRPLAWALSIAAPLLALDLRKATVIAPSSLSAREQKASSVLVEEVERRSQIRLPVAATPAAGPSIIIVNSKRGAREGYTLRVDGSTVRVEGNDERGVLFGVGHLLRLLQLDRGVAEIADNVSITTAPAVSLRGHQLGYRPKTNSYDAWNLAQWDQYIRELAIFGTNAIELIPPRSDDDDDSPHFPASKIDTMAGMSKIADNYGLDVWIWYPALDEDYSKPETVDFALKEWAAVFQRLPRIDSVSVPGGDPGHTHPKYLMPLLEKQAASLRRFHPKAEMWVSPQGFSAEWLDEFYAILRQEPAWLNGVVFGPQIRVSLAELRQAIPKRYPIRLYPDITHSLRCQYAVRNWDPVHQLTLHREPINPRPVDMKAIFEQTRPHTFGFITYSEGCNDDVNKFVWSSLGWNPAADPIEILREYSRYFIGGRLAEGFAQGLMSLERNWRGPLALNHGVYTTLQQFQAIDHDATPAQLANWRLQQAMYRAYYDAYNRSRLLYETALEEQAISRLRDAGRLGSLRAMSDAEGMLARAASEGVSQPWRARVFELAEALFQSIRMQLSVPWYKAIAVGRGANLDLIDTPLNNRPWLESRFAGIRTIAAEKDRLKALDEIVTWTNPGPGGFYDDLGNLSAQPHLVSGLPYAKDPDHLVSPLAATATRADEGPWRMSWITYAESRNDHPLEMEYRGLDRASRYKVRMVYGGEVSTAEFRLLADGREVHGWRVKDRPAKPVEFEVPLEATADGQLRLRWERKPGIGGAGRAVQLAEVWLVRQ